MRRTNAIDEEVLRLEVTMENSSSMAERDTLEQLVQERLFFFFFFFFEWEMRRTVKRKS
jgi:hypothetical protein